MIRGPLLDHSQCQSLSVSCLHQSREGQRAKKLKISKKDAITCIQGAHFQRSPGQRSSSPQGFVLRRKQMPYLVTAKDYKQVKFNVYMPCIPYGH